MKQRHPKIIIGIGLTILFAFSLLVNNHWRGDWTPNSLDEHSYAGAAYRMTTLDNLPLEFLVGEESLLFSYAIGLSSHVTGIDVFASFRLMHMLVLLLTIMGAYRLGRLHSTLAGMIFATLLTLYYAPSFYIGLWTMVPSVLMFVMIPNVFWALHERRYGLMGLWLILVLFIYWYALIPIVFSILLYLYLQSSKKRLWAIPLLFIVLFFVAPLGVRDWILGRFFPANAYASWYIDRLLEMLAMHVLAAFGFIIFLKSKDKSVVRLGTIALCWITTNLAFWILISTYAHIRTVIFLWLGLMLLSTIFFLSALRRLSPFWLSIIFMILMVKVGPMVFLSNQVEALTSGGGTAVPTFPAEKEGLYWLDEQTENPLIISDYRSMRLVLYYLPSANIVFFDENLYEIDAEALYDMFFRGDFKESDFVFFQTLQAQANTDEVYFMISARTRNEMYTYLVRDGKIRKSSLADLTAPHFYGENKFAESDQFELIYEDENILFYKWIPSVMMHP